MSRMPSMRADERAQLASLPLIAGGAARSLRSIIDHAAPLIRSEHPAAVALLIDAERARVAGVIQDGGIRPCDGSDGFRRTDGIDAIERALHGVPDVSVLGELLPSGMVAVPILTPSPLTMGA